MTKQHLASTAAASPLAASTAQTTPQAPPATVANDPAPIRLSGALADRELFSVDDVCAALKIGKTRCFEMIKRGELEGVLLGQSRRITRRSVEGLINSLPRQTTNAA